MPLRQGDSSLGKVWNISMKIKEMPYSDQPVFKLFDREASSLSESELLAIILGTGTHKCNAIELAQKLIKTFGNISSLMNISFQELKRINGIDEKKAAKVLAALELAKRINGFSEKQRPLLNSCRKVFQFMRSRLLYQACEKFYILFLNNSLHFHSCREFTSGTYDEITIYVRELMRVILASDTSNIILIHNHIEREPIPTIEDIFLTRQIKERCAYFDINLIDHLVIAEAGFKSILNTFKK